MLTILSFDNCVYPTKQKKGEIQNTCPISPVGKTFLRGNNFWSSYTFIVTTRSHVCKNKIRKWYESQQYALPFVRVSPDRIERLCDKLVYKALYMIFMDDWEAEIQKSLGIKNVSPSIYKTYILNQLMERSQDNKVAVYDTNVKILNSYITLRNSILTNFPQRTLAIHHVFGHGPGICADEITSLIKPKKKKKLSPYVLNKDKTGSYYAKKLLRINSTPLYDSTGTPLYDTTNMPVYNGNEMYRQWFQLLANNFSLPSRQF